MKRLNLKTILEGRWLPTLLTWAGLLLTLIGAISLYSVMRGQPKPESLEFSVTLPAGPTQTPTSASPPLILPETQHVINQATPTRLVTGSPSAVPATPSPTASPTPTVSHTNTPMPPAAASALAPNRITIPAINLDAPVIEVSWETQNVNGNIVSAWVVPQFFAAGWHKASAPPGQPGNTVLNGHHNIHGEVFRDLVNLEPGDEIVLYVGDTAHHYSVTERHILAEKGQSDEVRLQNAQWMMSTGDERLTMITCWPYSNNTHRVVVVALPSQQP